MCAKGEKNSTADMAPPYSAIIAAEDPIAAWSKPYLEATTSRLTTLPAVRPMKSDVGTGALDCKKRGMGR